MKTNAKTWGVDIVNRRKEKINPKPQYQRGAVWSEAKKQLLIDTILRGYDIPKFYLRETSEAPFEHEVVDGQQRFRAIWEFLNNEYPLGSESVDLPAGNLEGKFYKDLSSDIQDKLNLFELNIVIVENASDIEIKELFLRLQEGVSLNPAEKRNAMPGKMRDFVAEMAGHKLLGKLSIENKRFIHDDWVAHVVCLELAGGPTDVKAGNLKKMYESYENFDKNSAVAKKINKIFNYLSGVLEDSPPEMKIKWGFVDLYLLVSSLIDKYVLEDMQGEFEQFFIGFERERTNIEDPADLISKGHDQWDKDIYKYIQAFTTSGGLRDNIKTRHEVYSNKAFRDILGLEPKDLRRTFSESQKIVIWRRDNGQCKMCEAKVPFNEMHADHIKPHSKGGKTVVENGQTLCATCNLKKSAGTDSKKPKNMEKPKKKK